MPTGNLTGILSEAVRISSEAGRSGRRIRICSVRGGISSVGGSVGSTIGPANLATVGSIILGVSV